MYLAAPVIAARFGEEFEDVGELAILSRRCCSVVFPLLVMREPQASVAGVDLPGALSARGVIVWRAFAADTGVLYFIAAFFALATEAVWSAKYLTSETLAPALMTYAAFAALYLGVPQLARRRGTAACCPKPAAASS